MGLRGPQFVASFYILDGKALQGTIPTGQMHGRHLFAAYLPAEGWGLHQIEEVVYGITNLSSDRGSPARRLELNHNHWDLQNGLHYQ